MFNLLMCMIKRALCPRRAIDCLTYGPTLPCVQWNKSAWNSGGDQRGGWVARVKGILATKGGAWDNPSSLPRIFFTCNGVF